MWAGAPGKSFLHPEPAQPVGSQQAALPAPFKHFKTWALLSRGVRKNFRFQAVCCSADDPGEPPSVLGNVEALLCVAELL